MASCKDCLHYEACKSQVPRTFWDSENFYYHCKWFKDRNRFIELPCKIGDTVFVVNGFKEIDELEVDYYVVRKNVISVGMVDDGEYEVETVFLTREEAERALKNENRIVE